MYLLLNFSHTTFRKNIADSMPSCFSLGFIPSSSFHIQREKCQLLSDMAMPLKILCGAIGCVWSYRVSTKFIIRNCEKTSLCDYTENLGQSNSKGFILGSVLMSGLSSASCSFWTMRLNTRESLLFCQQLCSYPVCCKAFNI